MQTLAVIRGFHDHGICATAFSGDGELLCSVGLDIDHSIAVWRWEKGEKVASATGYCPISNRLLLRLNEALGQLGQDEPASG